MVETCLHIPVNEMFTLQTLEEIVPEYLLQNIMKARVKLQIPKSTLQNLLLSPRLEQVSRSRVKAILRKQFKRNPSEKIALFDHFPRQMDRPLARYITSIKIIDPSTKAEFLTQMREIKKAQKVKYLKHFKHVRTLDLGTFTKKFRPRQMQYMTSLKNLRIQILEFSEEYNKPLKLRKALNLETLNLRIAKSSQGIPLIASRTFVLQFLLYLASSICTLKGLYLQVEIPHPEDFKPIQSFFCDFLYQSNPSKFYFHLKGYLCKALEHPKMAEILAQTNTLYVLSDSNGFQYDPPRVQGTAERTLVLELTAYKDRSSIALIKQCKNLKNIYLETILNDIIQGVNLRLHYSNLKNLSITLSAADEDIVDQIKELALSIKQLNSFSLSIKTLNSQLANQITELNKIPSFMGLKTYAFNAQSMLSYETASGNYVSATFGRTILNSIKKSNFLGNLSQLSLYFSGKDPVSLVNVLDVLNNNTQTLRSLEVILELYEDKSNVSNAKLHKLLKLEDFRVKLYLQTKDYEHLCQEASQLKNLRTLYIVNSILCKNKFKSKNIGNILKVSKSIQTLAIQDYQQIFTLQNLISHKVYL